MNLKEIIKKYGIFILTLILVLSTIWFSISENNRSQKEFELRMRPHLILNKIKVSNTEYMLKIKNEGLTPARITIRRTALIEGNGEIISEDFQGEHSLIVGPSEETSLKENIPKELSNTKMIIESQVFYTGILKNLDKNWNSTIKHYHGPGESLNERIPKMYMN